METPLNEFDILAIALGANLLTVWGLWGFARLNRTDEWDWPTIFAVGVPGVVLMIAGYLGTGG